MSYQILSFSTSPFTQARIYSLLCDTAADLPASVDGYSVGQGWTAKIIEDGSSYIANAAGSWIQQPSSNQFSNVYTKDEIDNIVTDINDDIANAENDITDLHAGLSTIINSGGKNKMPIESGGVISGRWVDIAVNIPAGAYRISFGSVTSTDTDSTTCQILFFDSAFTQVSNTVQMSRGSDVSSPVTISDTAKTMRIYPASTYAGSAGDTMQFTKAMICLKSLWDVSSEFSPYCPTLAELYANVYTKEDVDSMVNAVYQTMLYYHTVQTSTTGTITFYALTGFVGSLTIYGNGQQIGTPTPDNFIRPEFSGTLDGTDWTIPITCAGQTVTVNLAQTNRTRKILKLVLDGSETWDNSYGASLFGMIPNLTVPFIPEVDALCTHYKYNPVQSGLNPRMNHGDFALQKSTGLYKLFFKNTDFTSTADFQAWIAAEYAANRPVTVWYVRENASYAMVNEPMAKIGEYFDVLSLTSTDIKIQTVSGENTLTVDTDIPPSKITISGE